MPWKVPMSVVCCPVCGPVRGPEEPVTPPAPIVVSTCCPGSSRKTWPNALEICSAVAMNGADGAVKKLMILTVSFGWVRYCVPPALVT